MLLARGEHRVDRDLYIAVGAVLEADRRRESGRELAMDLGLGRARADRAPRDQVADVLRRDDVEEFAARGHAGLVDAHEDVARDAQPLVDPEAAVQVRIVDQPFPADRGARLLEVHAHEDLEVRSEPRALGREPGGVGDRAGRIVDRARTDHHQQAIGLPVQDLAHAPARVGNQLLDRGPLDRKEADQVLRRGQRHDVLDPFVVGERGLVRGNRSEVAVGRCRHGCLPLKKKPPGISALAVPWARSRVRLAVPLRQRARKEKRKAVVPANHAGIQPRSTPDWQITPPRRARRARCHACTRPRLLLPFRRWRRPRRGARPLRSGSTPRRFAEGTCPRRSPRA